MSTQRERELTEWAVQNLGGSTAGSTSDDDLVPVSGDASFRRYFRISRNGSRYIVVDAPPEREDSFPFVAIARCWRGQGIHVPEVLAADLGQGFMLLEDFGDTLYLDVLDGENADCYYGPAFRALLDIMSAPQPPDWPLPPFDADLLSTEMNLFRDWLCARFLDTGMDAEDSALLQEAFDFLAAASLEQPRVPVHRDYHSRNLMVVGDRSPGILDFQDAVVGPVTYDLVSLLRDCYVQWPAERVQKWVAEFAGASRERGLHDADEAQFARWFDLAGVQRHLKASGIFARLWLRDGKRGYLGDVPRTLNYVLEACPRYPELAGLRHWILERMLPRMETVEEFRDSGFLSNWRNPA